MPKNIDDVLKEINKLTKDIATIESKLKDVNDIKRTLKSLDSKIERILTKIDGLESIIDAAELLEEHLGSNDNEDIFNTGWSPYDEEYEPEEYEDYNYEDEDET